MALPAPFTKVIVYWSKTGPDEVQLHSDIPNPFAGCEDSQVFFRTEVPRHSGSRFVRESFGVEPEIFNPHERTMTLELK